MSRAAADQRRGRAGRTEPGVCYRLWDEPETAALEPANRPEILEADLAGFALDLAQWGVAGPRGAGLARSAAGAGAGRGQGLLGVLGALNREAADADGRRLPPAAAAAARAHGALRATAGGRLAAEIAAVLSERGLGGTDVDLTPPRSVAPRPRRDARTMRTPWQSDGPPMDAQERGRAGAGRCRRAPSPARCSRLLIPIASPRTAAATELSRSTARRCRDPPAALAREPIPGGGRNQRLGRSRPHRVGGALTLAEIEAEFADRIASQDEIASIRRAQACAPAPCAGSARSRWQSNRARWQRTSENSAFSPRGSSSWVRAVAVDESPASSGATASCSCADCRIEVARYGPICPTPRSRATAAEWLAPVFPGKTALAALRSDEFTRGTARACFPGICAEARDRGAHPFHGADRLTMPIDYEARRDRRSPFGYRNCSVSTAIRP